MTALSETVADVLERAAKERRQYAAMYADSYAAAKHRGHFAGTGVTPYLDDPPVVVRASDLELLVRWAIEPDELRLLVELVEQYEELTEDEAAAVHVARRRLDEGATA